MFKKFKEIAILPKSSHIETDESETDDREYTKLSFFKGVREMRQQLFMHFRKNMDIEDPPLLSQKNSKTYRILGVKSLEKGGFKLSESGNVYYTWRCASRFSSRCYAVMKEIDEKHQVTCWFMRKLLDGITAEHLEYYGLTLWRNLTGKIGAKELTEINAKLTTISKDPSSSVNAISVTNTSAETDTLNTKIQNLENSITAARTNYNNLYVEYQRVKSRELESNEREIDYRTEIMRLRLNSERLVKENILLRKNRAEQDERLQHIENMSSFFGSYNSSSQSLTAGFSSMEERPPTKLVTEIQHSLPKSVSTPARKKKVQQSETNDADASIMSEGTMDVSMEFNPVLQALTKQLESYTFVPEVLINKEKGNPDKEEEDFQVDTVTEHGTQVGQAIKEAKIAVKEQILETKTMTKNTSNNEQISKEPLIPTPVTKEYSTKEQPNQEPFTEQPLIEEPSNKEPLTKEPSNKKPITKTITFKIKKTTQKKGGRKTIETQSPTKEPKIDVAKKKKTEEPIVEEIKSLPVEPFQSKMQKRKSQCKEGVVPCKKTKLKELKQLNCENVKTSMSDVAENCIQIEKLAKHQWICAGWVDDGYFFGIIQEISGNTITAKFVKNNRNGTYKECKLNETCLIDQLINVKFTPSYLTNGNWKVEVNDSEINDKWREWLSRN